MRTVLLIVIVLGLLLVLIGLITILRARIAQAMEQRRVERGDPDIIEGRARVVDRRKTDPSSGWSRDNNNRAGSRRDGG
ncbi:MAG: hypothetical protein ACUVRU_09160 [Anaerolineae bacterium]